ncbi:MAG TPA: type II CAAX endopeptidase family protein [Terriglobales bacterium]|nr:type II CAAX endopeptidase family protein [Terriglobales bacterium]
MSEAIIPDVEASPPLAPAPRDPPWGYLDLLLILTAVIIGEVVVLLLGFAVSRIIPQLATMNFRQLVEVPLYVIAVQTFSYGIVLAVMWATVEVRAQHNFFDAIHWKLPPRILMFAALGSVLAYVVLIISKYLPFPPKVPIEKFFGDPKSAYAMMAFGLLVAPFMEEVFFRGLLFPVLKRTFGLAAAMGVTAFLFALMHHGQLAGAWAPLAVLFAVGLVLTAVRVWSGSVAACWITHLAYNGTLFATIYYFSNGFRNMTR